MQCSMRHNQSDSQTRINCITTNSRLEYKRYTPNSDLLRQMGSSEIRHLCGLCSNTETYSRSSTTQDDSNKLPGKSMARLMSYRDPAFIPSHRSCRVLAILSTATGENPSRYRERSWRNDSDGLQTQQVVSLLGRLVQVMTGMATMWRHPKHDHLPWVHQMFRIHMAVKSSSFRQIMITREIRSWATHHITMKRPAR